MHTMKTISDSSNEGSKRKYVLLHGWPRKKRSSRMAQRKNQGATLIGCIFLHLRSTDTRMKFSLAYPEDRGIPFTISTYKSSVLEN